MKKTPVLVGDLQHKLTSELIPYINNSRTHSDEQINQVAASIKEFGFLIPVLIDSSGMIIAGHCRVAAAQRLKLDTIPCIVADHLTPLQIKAYVIADNKLALNSSWDEEILSMEMINLKGEGFNLNLLGFNDDELKIKLEEPNFDVGTEDEQGQLDELDPKWVACPHCGKEFDARQAGG